MSIRFFQFGTNRFRANAIIYRRNGGVCVGGILVTVDNRYNVTCFLRDNLVLN